MGGSVAKSLAIAGSLAVAGLGLAGAARAADLAPMYTKAPPVSAMFDPWTGFYAGVHLGWGWNDIDFSSYSIATGTTNTDSFRRDGVLGGGQLGYNWKLYPNWLIGFETDISGADI